MKTSRLDALNIGLMLLALAIALIYPFEGFLLGYAFIGPLHYLTEISWLHDRKHFCANRLDALFLIIPVIPYFLASSLLGEYRSEFLHSIARETLVFTFLSALVYHLNSNVWKRFVWLIAVTIATVLFSVFVKNSIALIIVGFLPSLIHVFIFTGIFILLGSLRNNSWLGYTSLTIFIACAILCFLNPLEAIAKTPSTWTKDIFPLFAGMASRCAHVLGFDISKGVAIGKGDVTWMYTSPTILKVMTFFTFAYLYHYFNWFSKTGLIGWHKIPKKRVMGIAIIWIASAGIYILDYRMGLTWLFLLSVAHVTLEFPLNWLSIKESGTRMIGLIRTRKSPA